MARGTEDKLHKQHCLEAQPNSNWFSLWVLGCKGRNH